MTAKNILFIMADQLRWDYLSCTGHPHLSTPHIDALAERGTLFSRAFAQSAVCGSSRMCFYTGRYARSHGASWNNVPLKTGELNIGDHLKPLGMRVALAGKTHMCADMEGMHRLGIHPDSDIGVHVAQCGFEPYERDDGLHSVGVDGRYAPWPKYNDYLLKKGYGGENPWHDAANSGEDEDGNILSGWLMKNAQQPARVRAEDSETAYMTGRAMDFIRDAGDAPWCLHLSYIKPHWPFIAPAPYHNMFGEKDILPPRRKESEKENPHPVYATFMRHRSSRAMSRDEVRRTVLPAYMGLIKEIDDNIGRLIKFLRAQKLLDNTMIVLTSDHGEYMGDHWLGDKDFLHDEAVRIPLIVVDPHAPAAARGQTCSRFVESIDLLPTFVEFAGGKPRSHILEGHSLLKMLHGDNPDDWRHTVFAETDYSFMQSAIELGDAPISCYLLMARNERWKYIHAENRRPLLFDLQNDPDEFEDLGDSPTHEGARQEMRNTLFEWAKRRSQRTTLSDADITAARGKTARRGIFIGMWEESDIPEALRRKP